MGKTVITALVLLEHSLIRAGMCDLLQHQSTRIDRVVSLDSAGHLLQAIAKYQPAIALLDYQLIVDNNSNILDALSRLNRPLPVLLMCEKYPRNFVSNLQKSVIFSCLSWKTSTAELYESVSALLAGKTYFPQELVHALFLTESNKSELMVTDVLSTREFEVFCFVARGWATQTIAREMVLNPKTVNTYRYRVFEKLGIDNNVKLTHLALRQDLVDLEAVSIHGY